MGTSLWDPDNPKNECVIFVENKNETVEHLALGKFRKLAKATFYFMRGDELRSTKSYCNYNASKFGGLQWHLKLLCKSKNYFSKTAGWGVQIY